jgi:WD40 repeat protein
MGGTADGFIRFMRLADGELIRSMQVSELRVEQIALHPNNQIVAAATPEGVVQLWSLTTGQQLNVLAPTYKDGEQVKDLHHPGINLANSISAVAFSGDGSLLAGGGAHGEVWVWRSADGQLLDTFYGHIGLGGYEEPVTSLSFSPDGQIVASAGLDDTVYLWNLKDGGLLHRLGDPSDPGQRRIIVFSPDGKMIATGGDTENVQLWSVEQGQLVTLLSDKQAGAFSLAWSRDGRLLAVGGGTRLDDGVPRRPYDTNIRIWNVPERRLLLTLHGHIGNVTGVLFMPDDQRLVSGSEDKSIRIWNIVY